MKKVALIGGLGKIGQVVYNGLQNQYNFIIIDTGESDKIPHIKANIADYQSLYKAIPTDTDIIFDLSSCSFMPPIVDFQDFKKMNQVYIQGIYNVFEVAKALNIAKVLYSSTSHVTGMHEKNGLSLLGRKIRERDYPLPDSIYGSMKLFAESTARLYSLHHKIKVICLRYGTVMAKNHSPKVNPRNKRIFLFHEDLLRIVKAAFESDIDFGIYYAVSENKEKPWSTRKLRHDLKLKRSNFAKKDISSVSHKIHMKFRNAISWRLKALKNIFK